MAKAAKTTEVQRNDPATIEAEIVPAPLAAAVEEQDAVLQAHFTRQQNHFTELAPSMAKKDREDKERELLLQEHAQIAERNRIEREKQAAAQAEREDRETAAARSAALREEIEALKAAIKDKTAEADRLEKLMEG